MGTKPAIAVIAVIAVIATGCFGYNRSAKKWAYVGNTMLILGGGGLIAADQLGSSSAEPSMTITAADQYDPPFSGVMLAGVVLAAAGLFGIVFNATRPDVKTSR